MQAHRINQFSRKNVLHLKNWIIQELINYRNTFNNRIGSNGRIRAIPEDESQESSDPTVSWDRAVGETTRSSSSVSLMSLKSDSSPWMKTCPNIHVFRVASEAALGVLRRRGNWRKDNLHCEKEIQQSSNTYTVSTCTCIQIIDDLYNTSNIKQTIILLLVNVCYFLGIHVLQKLDLSFRTFSRFDFSKHKFMALLATSKSANNVTNHS